MSGSGRGRGRHALVAAVAAVAALVSGCQSVTPDAAAQTGGTGATSVPAAPPPASITVSPASEAAPVRPDTPVVVTATGGRLTAVRLTDTRGRDLPGELAPDGTTWTSTDLLGLDTTYTVVATADNPTGATTTATSQLRTLAPADTASYFLLPGDGATVGVGMPAVVQFASPVPEARRDDVEGRMTIRTTPQVQGSWGWLDGRQLMWRPASYWKPGTKVEVEADLAGIETAPGRYVTRDASTSFTIGSATISTVDVRTHTLTMRRDGKVVRQIPVTTGKTGFTTRDGTKVVITREPERRMDAETTGLKRTDPEYYDVTVKYALRLTWSGEFIHAAPWSVASQGRANVSHGCTGMSTADARWMFENSRVGDVVTYVGSGRRLEAYNGYTLWNMPLAQWAQHSALA